MKNNTRNLKCYLCRKTINIGKNKKRIRKGQYIHSDCKRKTKRTLADKVIDWFLGLAD